VTRALLVVAALLISACSDPDNTQYLPVGSGCNHDSDCGTSPFSCAITGYYGGYCQKPCSTDGECPADSLCAVAVKQCRRKCATEGDCRPHYVCVPGASSTVCDVPTSGSPMDGGSP
jgi:hypothetical protein